MDVDASLPPTDSNTDPLLSSAQPEPAHTDTSEFTFEVDGEDGDASAVTEHSQRQVYFPKRHRCKSFSM